MNLVTWLVVCVTLIVVGLVVAAKATRIWRWRGRERPLSRNRMRVQRDALNCNIRTESSRAWRSYWIVRRPGVPLLIADRPFSLRLEELAGPYRIARPEAVLPGVIGTAPFHEVTELVWPGGRRQIAATPDLIIRLTEIVAELNDELGFGDADLLDQVLPAPDGPMIAAELHTGFWFSVDRRLDRVKAWSLASPRNAWVLAAAFVPLLGAAVVLSELGATKTVRYPAYIGFVLSAAMVIGAYGFATYSRRARSNRRVDGR